MKIKNAHSLEELINFIDNNSKVVIDKGRYLLSSLELYPNEHIFFCDVFDGKQLVLRGFKNLEIVASEAGETYLLAQPKYANVLTFVDCHNITLEGLVFGHTDNTGYCHGGVLQFENCTNVTINDTVLFGCGTEGLSLSQVKNFFFNNSTIKECTYRIMTVVDSYNLELTNSKFFNNGCFNLIQIGNSEKVYFTHCEMNNNWTLDDDHNDEALFNINFSREISIVDSYIHNNSTNYLVNNEGVLIEKNNKEGDNVLLKDRYNKSGEEKVFLDNSIFHEKFGLDEDGDLID